MSLPIAAWAAGALSCVSIAGGSVIGPVGALLLPVAVTGMLLAGSCASWQQWATAGAAFSLAWSSSQLIAFWHTSQLVAIASTAFHSMFVIVVFAGAAAIATRTSRPFYACLAAIWFFGAASIDECGWYTMTLSTGLFLTDSRIALPAQFVGPAGVDAILVLACGQLGARRWLSLVGTVVITIGIGAVAVACDSAAATGQLRYVHVVQPRIEADQYRAAGWSLSERITISERLFHLTREAAARQTGLIVWPEGGTGLPDLQLPSQRAALTRALGSTNSDAIIATTIVGDHGRYNGVGLLRAGALLQLTFKQHVVPIVEGDVAAGHSELLETRAGSVGVLICFDGLFVPLARELAGRGAELLVFTTDDASMGRSGAALAHVAATRYAAASVGLPLVVASNTGPSLLQDARGRIAAISEPNQMDVLTGTVAPSRGSPFAPWAPRALALCVGIAIAYNALKRVWGTNTRQRTT